jgi:signal transduction histidine kinase
MRRLIPLLWPSAAVVGLAAVSVEPGWSEPRLWVPDLAVGWVFIASGLVAAARRPESRSGPLMTATGFTWFIGNFADVAFEPIAWLAGLGVFVHRGPLFHLVLTYPTGRAPTRFVTAAVAAGYAAALVPQVWTNEATTLVLAGLLVAVGVGEFARSVGPSRRARAWAAAAAAWLGIGIAGAAIARMVLSPAEVSPSVLPIYSAALCLLAVVLCAGLLQTPWDRVGVTDLVIELGEARGGTLRAEFAAALGDPSLDIGYWLPEARTYVDAEGRTFPLPDASSHRSVTVVDRHGEPVAALVHDPAVLEEPLLVQGVEAAARLAAAHARLQAEVRSRVEELASSRARILQAADQERRHLERRLHDGAQRRLTQLAEILGRSRSAASTDRTSRQIVTAENKLERTLDDLGRLALGLHPRVLSEHTLEEALARIARACPVPVELRVSGDLVPSGAQAAVYFLCAEALTNVAKYADASLVTVTVAADDARVVVSVHDDGVGGADPAGGTGIRGLIDRIETLGGTLSLASEPSRGTHLAAEVPLGGEVTSGLPDLPPDL